MHNWDTDLVLQRYQHGIHWQLLRDALLGKIADLSAREKKILHVVVAGGFWAEERRWRAGISKSPLCTACGLEHGSQAHRIHDCGAFESERALKMAAGDYQRLPRDSLDPGLAPLREMGLPPLPALWQPSDIVIEEGDCPS